MNITTQIRTKKCIIYEIAVRLINLQNIKYIRLKNY
jgi:hypothetical protein